VALASTPVTLPAGRGFSLAALPQWWHLLSLDAPTVAALWSWTLARALHIHLPLTSPLLLALGTWLVYVADRILDGFLVTSPATLRERHFFYARHRAAFLAAALPAGLVLLWLIATRMNPAARHEDVAVFAIALLYFCVIHRYGSSAERWLPKELAVGLVFAAATAVPAWSRFPPNLSGAALSPRVLLLAAVLCFAALCWLNCVAIEKWERGGDSQDSAPPHRNTVWAQRRLRPLCTGVFLLALALAVLTRFFAASAGLPVVFLASAVTAVGFVALDRWQQRRRPGAFRLRIAADAVMLTPLLFLFLPR
jgi:hypothetical protein